MSQAAKELTSKPKRNSIDIVGMKKNAEAKSKGRLGSRSNKSKRTSKNRKGKKEH